MRAPRTEIGLARHDLRRIISLFRCINCVQSGPNPICAAAFFMILKLTMGIRVSESEEIEGLERQKERLLARMEIIERLQKSRPEIVHLFDEVARRLPEGVYLTGMRQAGADVEVTGMAQSSTRVSALMRQIESSDWLTDPGVTRVRTTDAGPAREAEFVVTLKQVSKSSDEEDAG